MNQTPNHIGHRRRDCWWEPIYSPTQQGNFVSCDWDFSHNTGPQRAFLPADLLACQAENGVVYKLIGLTFAECDFQGRFDHKPSILFDKCRFRSCDFAFSDWVRATFRNCEFDECSISLTSFTDCEFRDCQWSSIGFSGSKTIITRSFITNPSDLVGAGYSAPNPKQSSSSEHKCYQKYRLEGTKAHLARSLLSSHERVGDDKTYYETARLHDTQQTKSRISESIYFLLYGKWLKRVSAGLNLLFWTGELILLNIAGRVNDWGARLLQPLLILMFFLLLFGCAYAYTPFDFAIVHPWQKSFNIAILAGYTNEMTQDQPATLRLVESIQLVASIFLYTIFFSTAIARLSRSR